MGRFIKKILRKFQKQKLVLWKRVDSDAHGGDVYGDPTEESCRWEDKQQQVQTADGTLVQSTAYVLLGVEVRPDDLLFLGTLEDCRSLPSWPDPPTFEDGGRPVITVDTSPDLDASEFLYEAYL